MLKEESPVILNPLLEEFRNNPYPFFKKQRKQSVVSWNPIFNGWAVLDYNLTERVLKDDNRFSASRIDSLFEKLPSEVVDRLGPLRKIMGEWSLMVGPPYHGKLRGISKSTFTPDVVKTFKPKIERLVEELLAPFVAAKEFDLVQELTYPLPALVIADILGLPRARGQWFKKLSKEIVGVFNLSSRPDPTIAYRAQNAVLELNDYFNDILEDESRQIEGSLIQTLAQLEAEDIELTTSEILSTISLLLVAGHETTTNLLGNGMLCLLKYPNAYHQLKNDLGLLPGAIEEMLRFESPVQLSARNATKNLKLGETRIKKGERVLMFLGAANRDPEVFKKPESFDIKRSSNKHLGFGAGRHFCVGAMLARLEAEIAFKYLLEHFPVFDFDENEIEWHEDVSFRSLTKLTLKQ